MPITRIIVDNYMRVVHADLEPRDGINEITGLNGEGKTSFLDAVSTLGGKKNVAWSPIHDGAEEARITIDIDGVGEVPIRMVRTIKRNEAGENVQTVVVEGPGGARFPKPQELLNGIVGQFSFDPLAVVDMDEKQLRTILQRFVPDFDFEAIAEANKQDFDKRTDVNRQAKSARTRAEAITVPEDAGEGEDAQALLEELDKAQAHNQTVTDYQRRLDGLQSKLEYAEAERDRHVSEAKRLRELAAEHDRLAEGKLDGIASIQSEIKFLESPGEPIDTTDLRQRLSAAQEKSEQVAEARRLAAEKKRLTEEADTLEAESKEITDAMNKRKADADKAVASAKMPIEGLSFGDDERVLFNGQPLSQASQAERIRVSVAISAAMAPKLKVAIVKDGSLLDRNSWALLEKLAAEYGLQIFIETVDSERPTAIVIEGGRMKESGQMEAAE